MPPQVTAARIQRPAIRARRDAARSAQQAVFLAGLARAGPSPAPATKRCPTGDWGLDIGAAAAAAAWPTAFPPAGQWAAAEEAELDSVGNAAFALVALRSAANTHALAGAAWDSAGLLPAPAGPP